MITASEAFKARRFIDICRRMPPVQLDVAHAWNDTCLTAFAATQRLLGFAPSSIRHINFAYRMARFMFHNMHEGTTDYLIPLFNAINKCHEPGGGSFDYGEFILGLLNTYEFDRASRLRIRSFALRAHLAERIRSFALRAHLAERALLTARQMSDSDNVGVSDSDQNRQVAGNTIEFLRDEEQRRGKKRRRADITEDRPLKKRKLNVSKKAKLTAEQVFKAIAMTGDDSSKRTIVKYIAKTYNVDNNETLERHVNQVVAKGRSTQQIKKGSTQQCYSMM